MEGPRAPAEKELTQVIDFVTHQLRAKAGWTIDAEYPTAFTTNNIHNMRIITEDSQIISHALVKPHIVKSPHIIYKVGAIGSVVTDEVYRHKGYSSSVIQECLKLVHSQQCDVAILWSDLYDFYRKLGFELAGTEISLVIENPLTKIPENQLKFSKDSRVAVEAIYRLYSTHTVTSLRNLEEMKKFLNIPKTQVYTAWEPNGQLAAYAIEGKGADLNGYIHEWGGAVSKLIPLLDYIRKEKATPITVIAPRHAHNLIAQLRNQNVVYNEGFLGMIKIVNFEQLSQKIKKSFRNEGVHDIVLERQGTQFVFGCGKELFTLPEEADITRLLFGPVELEALDFIPVPVRNKLSKLLPLQFWMWGWDSV